MRVAIATGLFPPEIGGPATYSELLRDELPKRGIAVEVFPFSRVRAYPKIIRHFAYFFILLRGVRKADIVYALDPVSVGLPALLAARALRKRFLIKIVGDYAWEQGTQRFGIAEPLDAFVGRGLSAHPFFVRVLRRTQSYVSRKADTVVVPSAYLGGIVEKWNVPQERIRVVYNGVSAPELKDRDGIRRSLGIEGQVITSVGRLVPWKGFDALIEILPKLRERFPDLSLYIIGDGPEREALEEKIRAHGMGDRVRLLGRRERLDTLKYIYASDVFVLNTRYEGLSHTLIETMMLGTPIVTTPAGGNKELIEHEATGLLVPFNDRAALRDALESILSDSARACARAEHARQKAKQFTQERMLRDTMATFAQS